MNEIDAALIAQLGGPARVAELLDLGDEGAGRVSRWAKGGIPYRYRLEYLSLWRRAASEILRAAQGKRLRLAPEPTSQED